MNSPRVCYVYVRSDLYNRLSSAGPYSQKDRKNDTTAAANKHYSYSPTIPRPTLPDRGQYRQPNQYTFSMPMPPPPPGVNAYSQEDSYRYPRMPQPPQSPRRVLRYPEMTRSDKSLHSPRAMPPATGPTHTHHSRESRKAATPRFTETCRSTPRIQTPINDASGCNIKRPSSINTKPRKQASDVHWVS